MAIEHVYVIIQSLSQIWLDQKKVTSYDAHWLRSVIR